VVDSRAVWQQMCYHDLTPFPSSSHSLRSRSFQDVGVITTKPSLHSMVTSAVCKGFLVSGLTLKDYTCKGLSSRLLRSWGILVKSKYVRYESSGTIFSVVSKGLKESSLQGYNLTDSKKINVTFMNRNLFLITNFRRVLNVVRIICQSQGRIKLFGAPRQWKHFRPLFQAVFL